MEALLPLVVVAIVVFSRAGRLLLRREDVGRLVGEAAARIRAVESGTQDGRPTVPAPVSPPDVPPVPAAPRPASAPPPSGPAVHGAAPEVGTRADRRRRLAVRRDLVAAELLAAPVSLRPGGPAWR